MKCSPQRSSNNVHEPRNAEFTAFLGSFLPDDNNFGKYYLLINSLCVCRVALYIIITKHKED